MQYTRQAGSIAAADFFTVEALTIRGLVRYAVLFVIDLKTTRVHIAGIVHEPYGAWMTQIARDLTDVVDGFLRGSSYLIHDRDPLFTRQFRSMLKESGVDSVRLPARSPNLNADAGRFVGSIKSECLRRVVPLGERHLRTLVAEYVEHYHLERNHQGLDNMLIDRLEQGAGSIKRQQPHADQVSGKARRNAQVLLPRRGVGRRIEFGAERGGSVRTRVQRDVVARGAGPSQSRSQRLTSPGARVPSRRGCGG